jgi:hypothetical protein
VTGGAVADQDTVAAAQAALRHRGLVSAAVRGALIWPDGTLCRWAGPKSKTVFLVIGAREEGASHHWSMNIQPIGGSKLRRDFWTGKQYLARLATAVLEDRDNPGNWRGWCSCGFVTGIRRGEHGERNATRLLAAHTHDENGGTG